MHEHMMRRTGTVGGGFGGIQFGISPSSGSSFVGDLFHSVIKRWEIFLRLKSEWAFEPKGVGSALSGKQRHVFFLLGLPVRSWDLLFFGGEVCLLEVWELA